MSNTVTYDRIVFFGDSLTDSRVFYDLTEAYAVVSFPPSPPYAEQFSNGPVYADYVPGLLGIEGGEEGNYAIGGAQALTDRSLQEFIGPLLTPTTPPEARAFRVDLDGQIDRYLASEPESIETTAALVFMGANDLADFIGDPTPAEAFAFGETIGDKVIEDSRQLVEAGVDTLILGTLPNFQFSPARNSGDADGLATFATVVDGANAAIRDGAAALESAGASVVLVDFQALWEEVRVDLPTFGFQVYGESVILGQNGLAGIVQNPATAGIPVDQVVFFDEVHPGAEFHEINGIFVAETLSSHVTIGDDGRDRITGVAGDDLVLASGGNDRAILCGGDDTALMGLGDDLALGGRGDDVIAGGSGNDILKGQAGDDILATGAGRDLASGGRGDDLLIAGTGDEALLGGSGDDVFVWTEAALYGRAAEGRAVISGGRGHDTLILRVSDADAVDDDLGWFGTYNAADLFAFGIEEVIVTDGLEFDEAVLDRFAALDTAELWNFV